MRSAVIVIGDLYLQSGESHEEVSSPAGAMPALEYAGRFGERARLVGGWRWWLAGSLGRADLAAAAVADVAAATLASDAGTPATRWIATPVDLIAGLTRPHLSRRGILRLSAEEQAELSGAFQRTFAGSNLRLHSLCDGQFLLSTPEIAPLDTPEPARCAGGEIQVPRGAPAAPLLRLMAEIEMWLHGEPLNAARRARALSPITGLWLWGAAGGAVPRPDVHRREASAPFVACGADAWLAGLCRLHGGAALPLPENPAALLADPQAERAVFLTELAAEPSEGDAWSLPGALATLDRRLVAPALHALRSGAIERLTIVANDIRIGVGRYSGLRRWRRRRAGLTVFG